MTRREVIKNFILGTAVEITSIFSIATATSATITILDSSLNVMINAANMTKQADKVYSYIYQSVSTDLDGLYTIRLAVTSGGYTVISEDYFHFTKQTGT